MHGPTCLISIDNFINQIYKMFNDINIYNIDYINELKNEYFELVDNKNLAFYKAYPIISTILKKRGYNKIYFYRKKHMNSLGYNNENDMYLYIKNKISTYEKSTNFIFKSIDKSFDIALEKELRNFNFNNIEYYNKLKTLIFEDEICIIEKDLIKKINQYVRPEKIKGGTNFGKKYWLDRGYSEEEAKNKISEIQRKNSYRCVEHYIKKGYSEEEAKKLVSSQQRKVAICSKSNKEYWLKLNFSEEDAIKLAHDYASKTSVRSVKYWISKGYSEEEAKKKTLEYNSASSLCKCYKNYNDYLKHVEKMSNTAKYNWKNEKYRNSLILAAKEGRISGKTKSIEEFNCFDFLQNEIDKNIKHEAYIVIIPDYISNEEKVNTYFYSCDGYLECENKNVIVFEYDGEIYHNKEKDELRDNNILGIDERVLGIIRIKRSFHVNKNIDKKTEINNAIQKIKNSTENRIILQ